MPIITRSLGPGTLTLGAGALEASSQLTSCKVTPSENVESGDAIQVLSGERLEADETVSHSFVLEGNFLQDQGAVSSVVAFSWDQAGTEVPFSFTPATADGVSVTGTLVPVPLTIGGDEPGRRMASDFSWRIKGYPDLS